MAKKKVSKKRAIKDNAINGLKGFAIGAANVIPGVSGGTIALITGIFERLINAIKSFDVTALKLLGRMKFREFFRHIDGVFLTAVGIGLAAAIVTLARILEYLFENYPVEIWSFFFGLILASVYYVGKTVGKWDSPAIISFAAGTAVAVGLSFLNPAVANANPVYVFLCGMLAVSSMILPGISGSFVLMLMGNYELVIRAVNEVNVMVLGPLALGCAFLPCEAEQPFFRDNSLRCLQRRCFLRSQKWMPYIAGE
jgi:putative membrane protein